MKACPFCGSAKDVMVMTWNEINNPEYPDPVDTYHTICNADDEHDGCGGQTGNYPTKEAAIAAWENRE